MASLMNFAMRTGGQLLSLIEGYAGLVLRTFYYTKEMFPSPLAKENLEWFCAPYVTSDVRPNKVIWFSEPVARRTAYTVGLPIAPAEVNGKRLDVSKVYAHLQSLKVKAPYSWEQLRAELAKTLETQEIKHSLLCDVEYYLKAIYERQAGSSNMLEQLQKVHECIFYRRPWGNGVAYSQISPKALCLMDREFARLAGWQFGTERTRDANQAKVVRKIGIRRKK